MARCLLLLQPGALQEGLQRGRQDGVQAQRRLCRAEPDAPARERLQEDVRGDAAGRVRVQQSRRAAVSTRPDRLLVV